MSRKPFHKRPIWSILFFDLTLLPWLKTISAPFISRKPWAAACASFITHPIAGMFYLGRWKRALFYAMLSPCMMALEMYLLLHVKGFPESPVFLLDAFVLRLIGAVDAYFIARKWIKPGSQRWFTRWYAAIGLWLSLLAATYGAHMAFSHHVAEIFSATADITKPTIEKDDFFMLYRRETDYQRGDVAFIDKKIYGTKRNFFWRVIGLPGDTIAMEDGAWVINGEKAVTSYSGEGIYNQTLQGGEAFKIHDTTQPDMAEITVPEGVYFLVSDDRDIYRGTPFFNNPVFIEKERLKGKVLFVCKSPCPLKKGF